MSVTEACEAIVLIGIGMNAAAMILSIIKVRCGKAQRAEVLQRFAKIFMISGMIFCFLGSILLVAQASQSGH